MLQNHIITTQAFDTEVIRLFFFFFKNFITKDITMNSIILAVHDLTGVGEEIKPETFLLHFIPVRNNTTYLVVQHSVNPWT